jgi:O-antigen/teichoic acid export membrane protein
MSLTEKVIKNTIYHFTAQTVGFLAPFILTPIIITHIGQVQFGIYAIVLGFVGTFGLFDFSISTSFIKFISEHYNKKEITELNNVINTGLFFYLAFTLIICIVGLVFAGKILSFVNVPADLIPTGLFALRISLLIFFIATSSSIFVSVLVSLQKMYVNSLIGLIINILNFGCVLILLKLGYGLEGILYSQLAAVTISVFFNVYLAKKEMPEISISPKYLNKSSFKKMSVFGAQMQVSRIAGFLSEKYDEMLLGYFSTLNNVTFFNLAGRVSRLGRFFPLQLFQQAAPIAAELNAKQEESKLSLLFLEASKYLTIFSLPIFIFIYAFADLIMVTWVGEGYHISAHLLRILALGQIVNLLISAPGNSIIPNLGYPKFLMYEGIINLAINLVLSFFLIKYYGIVGAAIGTTAAIIISSAYIYITSAKYFKEPPAAFIFKTYLKPVIISVFCAALSYLLYRFVLINLNFTVNRLIGITYLSVCGIIFLSSYILVLLKANYLNERDYSNLQKLKKILNPFGKQAADEKEGSL